MLRAVNLDKADKDPAKSIPRKGKNSEALRALIAEAKDIIKERADLIAALRVLRPYARRHDALAVARAARAQAAAPAPTAPTKDAEVVAAQAPVANEGTAPAPVSTITKWALAAAATADTKPQIPSARRRAIRS